jgi:hypothetical protein
MSLNRGASILVIASSLVVLSACGMAGRHKPDTTASGSHDVYVEGEQNHRFAGMFGRKRTQTVAGPEQGIGVNSYLWRAALDTLAFMPLSSADPWGGVIISDWYINPEKPDERFKTTVYILDTRLRADALNVTVFKQVRDGAGNWADSAVSGQTEQDLENTILTRARQLRLANVGSK